LARDAVSAGSVSMGKRESSSQKCWLMCLDAFSTGSNQQAV
jgi:hypothetical protein